MEDDVVNKVVEVLADGSVHVRNWSSQEHDLGHIGQPSWL
jgi:hypothetical protein